MQKDIDTQPSDDLLLILDKNPESIEALRVVAARLGCSHVATDSALAVPDILANRRPTIAVLASDCMDVDDCTTIQSLWASGARPHILLLGSDDSQPLASARRAAESFGLPIVGAVSRPIDAAAVERLLSPCLATRLRISLSELEQALSQHELLLVYQLKVAISLEGLRVQGVEALVRWQHPRRGLLMPREFLDAVNEHGLMTNLTDFVMTEALRQLSLWQERGLSLEMVVNLNARLVRDREFPERLASLLQENGVAPQRLILDIVEVSNTDDRTLVLDVLRRLRVLGVGLSIDNFGTGMSSLAEIYRMPFSEIKVDRSLIADLPREHEALVLMRAIADLGHALHLKVCAAGVETRQMLESVRAAGFDSAQGHFFSGPVQAEDIERLVLTWPSFGPGATGSWRVRIPPALACTIP
jgi:EAL domain-containing protein (putative c-di-GMP-specific phosphodiesterase class I)